MLLSIPFRPVRFLGALLLFITGAVHAQPLQQRLRHLVDSVYAAHPAAIGIQVHVDAPDRRVSWSYAVGTADKATGKPLAAGQPVLLASNTKTYVAAAVLRLVETGKIRSLDGPVGPLLPAGTAMLLTGAGYDLDRITLRQLASHTSGLRDYVDPGYFDTVNTQRRRQWTRDEQIARAVRLGGPYAPPGDSFRYADVNYLLLTEVIEGRTGQPFYTALRTLLGYRAGGLNATWFVQLEPVPKGLPPLAHQYWNKYPWDAYDLNPSWDLYGGGGIAAPASDLARFFQRLFTGKIIRDTALLAQLHAPVPGARQSYSLGVRTVPMAGGFGYYHGGFWGTDAIYLPALNASIAIVVLERSERELSAGLCGALARELQRPAP